ncbi:MAG: Copper homeostasis protein CutC [Candidatus Erwinia impunctatus]|nr:Copper homeostasis protein CutC [Culicoides impunctatus]
MRKLEICCFGLDCALTAEQAGADRIELCASPAEGGLTPSAGCLALAREMIQIPVHPIVRPRGGDFCYSDLEFREITADIARIKDLGFPGVVTGVLDHEGHIDMPRMRHIMCHCEGMSVTFHRAFDICHNPLRALEQLTELGIDRILTSGQQQSAESGLALIKALSQQTQGPVIMPGAGVRLGNLHKFIAAGLTEIHSSASRVIASAMRYRKAGVSMSSAMESDEFSRIGVDADTVGAMKMALMAV